MLQLLRACVVVATIGLSGYSAYAHEGVNAEIAALGRKIEKDPRNATLYIERAALLRREALFVRALADLAAAQKIDPNRSEITLEKGLTLAAKGDAKEAETLLSTFLSTGKPSAKAFAARARLREHAQRFAEARTDYARAVALDPSPDLFLARGRMDEKLVHWDEAAQGYEEGMRKLSGAVALRLALIRVENKRGHYDRAIALVDEILPNLPIKSDWLLLRADQHAAAGRPEQARQDRETALHEADQRLTLRPTDFTRLTRARALVALGRKQEATLEVESVVAHAPNLEEARVLLEQIKQSPAGK